MKEFHQWVSDMSGSIEDPNDQYEKKSASDVENFKRRILNKLKQRLSNLENGICYNTNEMEGMRHAIRIIEDEKL